MLNEHTLDKYGIIDGSTVCMTGHLNGGGGGIDDSEGDYEDTGGASSSHDKRTLSMTQAFTQPKQQTNINILLLNWL
eukprot:7517570-Heterocapsa_arctica.AAC.1